MKNKLKNFSIIATSIAVFGVLTDATFSAIAYSINPTFFYKYEFERNFANFLHHGEFPFILLTSVIGTFFLLALHSYYVTRIPSSKNKKELTSIYILIMLAIFLTRTSGGLSWFILPSQVVFIFQGITIAVIILYSKKLLEFVPKRKPT